MSDTLLELRARVRKAEGPDREIDGALARAFGLPHGPKDCVDIEARSEWKIPEIARPYTGSTDAALCLAETLLPDHWYEGSYANDPSYIECHNNDVFEAVAVSRARTRPLAILDALLSALISKEPHHG